MAVFSRVNRSALESSCRLDAEYYQPFYTASLSNIKQRDYLRVKKLGVQVFSGPFGSFLKSESYHSSGHPFIRISSISGVFIEREQLVFLDDFDFQRLSKFHLMPLDIVLSKIGTVGRLSLITDDIGVCAISENNIGIRFSQGTSQRAKSYLFLFLLSKYGQLQLTRMISGNVQPKLNIQDIENIILPAHMETIKWENIIKQVYFHHHYSRSLYQQAEQLLLSELGLQNCKPAHTLAYVRNYSQAARARRIDAEYFQPKYAELRVHIRNYAYGYLKITDIAKNSDETIEPRAQPEKDFDYIELADINQVIGTIESANAIKGKDAPSRARMLLRSGDVIASTVEGSLDKVALVSEEHDGAIGSTGFFVLRPRTVAGGYLLALTESPIVQEQMRCESSGTILAAVPSKSLRNIIVPNIPPDEQDEIAALVQQSHAARREAKMLLDKAKRAVEIAIEENEERAISFLA